MLSRLASSGRFTVKNFSKDEQLNFRIEIELGNLTNNIINVVESEYVKKIAAIFIDIQRQLSFIQGVSFHNTLINQTDIRENLNI